MKSPPGSAVEISPSLATRSQQRFLRDSETPGVVDAQLVTPTLLHECRRGSRSGMHNAALGVGVSTGSITPQGRPVVRG